jgi:hypothetical protein
MVSSRDKELNKSNARSMANFPVGKFAVDIPNIAFASCLAGWVGWYCWDAWHANAAIENVILILPVSALGILLYFLVVAGCFKRVSPDQKQCASSHEPVGRGMAIKIVGSMAMLAGLVLAGPLIGFDIASFVYMLGMMAFLGERRILVLLFFPLLFSVVVIYCFTTLLATPLPVLIFRGQN